MILFLIAGEDWAVYVHTAGMREKGQRERASPPPDAAYAQDHGVCLHCV